MTRHVEKAAPHAQSEGRAFVLKDQSFTGSYGNVVFESLLFGFKPYLLLLGVLILIGAAGRLCFLATTWIAGIWADDLAGHAHPRSGAWLNFLSTVLGPWHGTRTEHYVAAMGACACVGFVLTALYRVPVTRIGALSASRFYDAITQRTSNLPQSFFDRTPVGRIVSRFSSDYGAVLRMAGGPFGEFVALVIDLILVSVALGMVSTAFLPVLVINVAANALVYFSQRNPMRDTRRELSRTRGPCLAHFAEMSQGCLAVRLFGKAPTFRQRFMSLAHLHLATKVTATWVLGRFAFALVFVTSASLVLTAWIGITWTQSGALSMGQLAVAFTYVTMLAVTTQQFFDYLGRFDEALTGVERLGEYMALEPEPGASANQARVQTSRVPLQNDLGKAEHHDSSVQIVDLCMGYGADSPLVLGVDDPLNIKISSGERLGIVGRTGSGKSSIINAVFYLYPFERGYVTACSRLPEHALESVVALKGTGAGTVTATCSLLEYRQQMALIAQDPVLFRGTLAENLEVARRPVSAEDMESALAGVGLGDWLYSLSPSGTLASRLGYGIIEGGLNLSAGQRQLVCMARALLENAPILVMDEATSAVDPRSEDKLMQAATTLLRQKTQIRVAHRLTTLEDCDRILWLDRGRIKMCDRAETVLRAFTTGSASFG